MSLVEGGVAMEGPLAIRHAVRAAEAMKSAEELEAEEVIGYILHEDELSKAVSSLGAQFTKGKVRFVRATQLPRDASIEWEITYKIRS